MGAGSLPGVKRPGRGVDHPPPPKRRGHERVGLYLYSPSGPSWPVLGRTLLLFVNNMENKRNVHILMTTSIYLKCGFILQKGVMKNFITHRYKSADEVHKMKVYNGENVSVRLFHFRNYRTSFN